MSNELQHPKSPPVDTEESAAAGHTASDHTAPSTTSPCLLETYRKRYDVICLQVLAQKQVLIPLLQQSVSNFDQLSPEQVSACLTYEPAISTVPVHRSDLGSNANVDDIDTFNIVIETKTPCPDINPNNFLINIEVRDDLHLEDEPSDCELAFYYVFSLLDKQAPPNLNEADYTTIKPSRSVWIFLNPPEQYRNFVNRFELIEKRLPPRTAADIEGVPLPCSPTAYSFIGLGGPVNEFYSDILELLHVLFVSSDSVEQKCDILKHKFGFTLTPELTQGLNDMFEFSQKIVTESLAQGRKEVLDQLKAIKELRRSGKSLDEALQAFNIPESEQPSFRDLLS